MVKSKTSKSLKNKKIVLNKKIIKTKKKTNQAKTKRTLKESSDKFIGVTRDGLIKTTQKSINKNITNLIIPGMTYSGATLVDILITKYMRAIDLLDAQTGDFDELENEEKVNRRNFYYSLIDFDNNKKIESKNRYLIKKLILLDLL